jgi:hypothetical protein
LDFGKCFGAPNLHKFWVLLIRSTKRFLRALAQLSKQSSYRDFTEANAEFLPDYLPHHRASPERVFKTKLQGILAGDRFVDPAKLGTRKLRRATRNRLRFECFVSALTIFRKPVVDLDSGKFF